MIGTGRKRNPPSANVTLASIPSGHRGETSRNAGFAARVATGAARFIRPNYSTRPGPRLGRPKNRFPILRPQMRGRNRNRSTITVGAVIVLSFPFPNRRTGCRKGNPSRWRRAA